MEGRGNGEWRSEEGWRYISGIRVCGGGWVEGRGNGEVKSERGMMVYKWYKSMWRWMGGGKREWRSEERERDDGI